MRNLTKALAMVSLLAPASAYPLGIGEIKLHSALNQNLDAEIALVLAHGEKADDIKVSLAPPEKFDESGVPWTYFLAKLKFQTITSGNHVLIRVTSKEALKEPFLDFLLEVTWPKGNLYREFTVLVDPPTFYDQAMAPVAVQEENEGYQQEPAFTRPQAITRRSSRSIPAVSVNISSGQYGPTRRNDTLWNVAERISRQTGISIEQTMIGLYEANPGAFYKPNVNALLAGKTLKIPEREVFLQLSRQQALAQFNQQNVEWRNRSVESEITSVAPARKGGAETQLTLEAPKQEPSSEASTSVSAGVQPAGQEEAKATAAETGVTEQPATAETAEQPGAAASNKIIEDKITALEQQLAAMQKLIALKDEQLAALQQQGQTKPAAPQQQELQKAVQEPTATEQPAKPIEQQVKQPVAQKPITPPTAKIAKPQAEEEGTVWYFVGGGIGTGFLVYLGWLYWRKREQGGFGSTHEYGFSDKFQPSVKASDIARGSFLEEQPSSSAGLESENLFGGELAVGEFDMFDIDQEEIDPVSEADVYMAYGRYQQADELIKLAIKDQPERDDYKLKLLEVFFACENRQAFEDYANELFNTGKNNNEVFWEKVVEMGGELCPGSVLFSTESPKSDLTKTASFTESAFLASPVPSARAEQPVSEVDNSDKLLDETDFDLTSFEELFDTGSTEKFSMDDAGQMLFGYEEETLADNDSLLSVPADGVEKNNQPIEFDLTGFSISDEKVIDADNEPDLKPVEAMAFETIGQVDSTAESLQFEPTQITVEDHDEFTFSLEKPLSFKESIAKTEFDDDFDFNVAASGTAGQFDDNRGLGATDITEMDEMELQLDLAIAYIDMGDKDAAREIATQVYEKGTVEQKMVAKSLLDNI